ncbi:MAG: hypothetical protein ACRDP4_07095 [Nocardioidaceae bacterium]
MSSTPPTVVVAAATAAQDSPPYELLPLGIIVLLVILRVRGRVLRPRRMVVLPAALLVVGCAATTPVLVHSNPVDSGVDAVVLAADVALSVVLGAVRGATVLIENHEVNTVVVRYGVATVALWLASILARGELSVVAHAHGASAWVSGDDVLAMLGVSLLVQNLLVIWRVQTRAARATAR